MATALQGSKWFEVNQREKGDVPHEGEVLQSRGH
jgi:hypothetical protein